MVAFTNFVLSVVSVAVTAGFALMADANNSVRETLSPNPPDVLIVDMVVSAVFSTAGLLSSCYFIVSTIYDINKIIIERRLARQHRATSVYERHNDARTGIRW